MAIFAQRTRTMNSYVPTFKLVSSPSNGQGLVWSTAHAAFINQTLPGSGPAQPGSTTLSDYVLDGVDLSVNQSIFTQKNNQKLEFRGLKGGTGIRVDNLGTDLLITDNLYETGHWLNSGIQIVFDDNGIMKFYKRGYRFIFNPTMVYSAPNEDIEIVASNPGQIISQTQNFQTLGFFAGQKIKVLGTGEQDGEWTIGTVQNDTITLTTGFASNLDAGLQPPTTITGSRFQIINGTKVNIYGIDLTQTELAIGDTIVMTGTTSNNGSFTVASFTQNQITVNEAFAIPFLSEYGNIQINTPQEDLPIGVQIDQAGNLQANIATFQEVDAPIIRTNNLFIGSVPIAQYIENLDTQIPSGGFVVGKPTGAVVRSLEVTSGLNITNADGEDGNPSISLQDYYINITGDVSGYTVQTGRDNVTISTELELIGSPGEYNLVTVDNKGRVLTGTRRILQGGPGINVVNGDGVLGDPTIHPNDFTITLTGDIQGEVTITDLGDAVLATTFTNASPNVITGQWFNRVQVNDHGWVVAQQNQSILGSNGVNIFNGDGVSGNPVISVNDFTITVNGDVTGQVTVSGLNDSVLDLALPDLIIPGMYNQVTVDSKGRVIDASNVIYNFQSQNSLLDTLSDPQFDAGILSWNGTQYDTLTFAAPTNELNIVQAGSTINISFADNPVFTGVASITIPYGPINFRPSVPTTGMLRVNTDDTVLEAYINGDWRQFLPGTQEAPLLLQGGTMQGSIDLGGHNLTNVDLLDGRPVADLYNFVDNITSSLGMIALTSSGFVGRTVQVAFENGLSITNPDGINGDPVLSFSVFDFETGATRPSDSDEIIYHDLTDNTTKKTTIANAFRRPAHQYFMAQF